MYPRSGKDEAGKGIFNSGRNGSHKEALTVSGSSSSNSSALTNNSSSSSSSMGIDSDAPLSAEALFLRALGYNWNDIANMKDYNYLLKLINAYLHVDPNYTLYKDRIYNTHRENGASLQPLKEVLNDINAYLRARLITSLFSDKQDKDYYSLLYNLLELFQLSPEDQEFLRKKITDPKNIKSWLHLSSALLNDGSFNNFLLFSDYSRKLSGEEEYARGVFNLILKILASKKEDPEIQRFISQLEKVLENRTEELDSKLISILKGLPVGYLESELKYGIFWFIAAKDPQMAYNIKQSWTEDEQKELLKYLQDDDRAYETHDLVFSWFSRNISILRKRISVTNSLNCRDYRLNVFQWLKCIFKDEPSKSYLFECLKEGILGYSTELLIETDAFFGEILFFGNYEEAIKSGDLVAVERLLKINSPTPKYPTQWVHSIGHLLKFCKKDTAENPTYLRIYNLLAKKGLAKALKELSNYYKIVGPSHFKNIKKYISWTTIKMINDGLALLGPTESEDEFKLTRFPEEHLKTYFQEYLNSEEARVHLSVDEIEKCRNKIKVALKKVNSRQEDESGNSMKTAGNHSFSSSSSSSSSSPNHEVLGNALSKKKRSGENDEERENHKKPRPALLPSAQSTGSIISSNSNSSSNSSSSSFATNNHLMDLVNAVKGSGEGVKFPIEIDDLTTSVKVPVSASIHAHSKTVSSKKRKSGNDGEQGSHNKLKSAQFISFSTSASLSSSDTNHSSSSASPHYNSVPLSSSSSALLLTNNSYHYTNTPLRFSKSHASSSSNANNNDNMLFEATPISYSYNQGANRTINSTTPYSPSTAFPSSSAGTALSFRNNSHQLQIREQVSTQPTRTINSNLNSSSNSSSSSSVTYHLPDPSQLSLRSKLP